MSATAGIATPSVASRAFVAAALIVGFYLTTLGVALALFGAPLVYGVVSNFAQLRLLVFAIVVCWVPASMLVLSMFTSRRRDFTPEGRRLLPDEAPELFAMIQTLASLTNTRAPADVYLTRDVELAVTELRGGRRVLIIGAPMLAWVTVEELRAGLAHEFGHFAFGDTRLNGIITYAHASFAAVIRSTERSAFADTGIWSLEVGFAFARTLGNALTQTYAKFFFWFTRRADRRAELAADQLAAKLVGADPAIRLLEKVGVGSALYDIYVEQELDSAISAGVMPTDLADGFAKFSSRMKARGIAAKVEELLHKEETDIYDTHPTFAVRVEALRRGLQCAEPRPDTRAAVSLVGIDVDAWMGEQLMGVVAHALPRNLVLARMPWADVPQVLGPHCASRARELAAQLYPAHPSATTLTAMLAAVTDSVANGHLEALVRYVEPRIDALFGQRRQEALLGVATSVIQKLFIGALLERGARMAPSLGEPSHVVVFENEAILVGEVAARALNDAAGASELRAWVARLSAAPSLPAELAPDPHQTQSGAAAMPSPPSAAASVSLA